MNEADSQQSYETGGFRIDPAQRVLLGADGGRVPLSSRAFELLLMFVRHPGELLDKNRLMAAVWPNNVVEENNLTQSVGALRKALGEAPGEHRFLVTEPGRGYRFVAPVRKVAALPRKRWPRPARIASIALGLLLVGGIVAAIWSWRRAESPAIDRSIAVLPFESHSEASDNAYLALGIQDEVLTLLTRVADLRVVPRTSTLRYAHGDVPGPQIGRELGVSYLLQGNVQRAGDTIRVRVTLVDAAADRNLWAQSYERSAADIFAIESEVAQSVAAALQARLTGEERRLLARPPTESAEAYDAYLRARASAERISRTESEIQAAISAYEEAVRADPGFAIAWAQLSRRHANLYSLAYDRSPARREAAARALDEASRLAPDLWETQSARAYFMFVVAGDLDGAERLYRDLERRAPQRGEAAGGLFLVTRELGQFDLSLEYARRALQLDPLNPYVQAMVCQSYATGRELDLAMQTCERALTLLPGDPGTRALLATIYQARGELDRARHQLQGLTPAPDDWRSLRVMSRQLMLDRKPADAAGLLERALEHANELGMRRGFVRRWLADAQRLAADPAAARASYAGALADLESEIARQPDNPAIMAETAVVHARLGSRQAGERLLQRCMEPAGTPRRESSIADCRLAGMQVALAAGDAAEAVRQLREALTMRGAFPPLTRALLRLDPEFDPLRTRDDFRALQ
jgi:TolB-like protein/DNA-binding winged helix-turn-helix (wHTH) protein/Tfp pilus assembly protein PilF